MERVEYFSGWRDRTFRCPSCGWEGKGAELEIEMFDALFVLECPTDNCWCRIAGAPYPVRPDVKAAAAAGNEEAKRMLEDYGRIAADSREGDD